MMKRFLALVIICICCGTAMAQVKNYTLKGYMGVQGGESFSYRLVFSDSAGNIKGYSLTYLSENKDIKAWITGRIDRKNKTLSFHETSIVYNNGFVSNAIICLVDAQLHYVPANKGNMLEGPLTSKNYSNAECARGSINFVNDDVLKELFSETAATTADTIIPVKKQEPAKVPEKKKPMMVVYDTARNNRSLYTPSAAEPDRITANVEKVYDWNSDTVVIDIWDGSNIDGDVVSVLYNGNTVLQHYSLKEKKKQLRIPLSSAGMDTITILAEEEGNEPPNTANLSLTDGSIQHQLIAYNNKGKKAEIKIRKKKK